MNLGKIEIIVIIALVITLLFTGGKKLPELAKGIGEAARELKKGFRGDDDKDDDDKKTANKDDDKKS